MSCLSGQNAEEDEDEHALEGVSDGEQIGSQGGFIKDVQDPEGPRGPQHKQQGHGPTGARPEGGHAHVKPARDRKQGLQLSVVNVPDVFIVADLRLLHCSVSVDFVHDDDKSQEVNLFITNTS